MSKACASDKTLKAIQRMAWGLLVAVVAAGCMSEPRNTSRTNRGPSSKAISNTPSSVAVGYGRILLDSPLILSKNPQLSPDGLDLNRFLRKETEFIKADGDTLDNRCSIQASSTYAVDLCYTVQLDPNTTKLTNPSRRWAYNANSDEFLQVHTFAHQKRIHDRFLAATRSLFIKAAPDVAPALKSNYTTAIPAYLLSDYAFWNVRDPLGLQVVHWPLNIYPGYDFPDNAAFYPTDFSLRYGYNSVYKNLKFAHDPTIIYHETGHALAYIMINARNMVTHKAGGAAVTPPSPPVDRSNLGSLAYDEAGSIGEGLADFMSYYVNGRTHFGEWALGRLLNLSRPMEEDEELHKGVVGLGDHERLSYPNFVNYEPNTPGVPIEDIHNAGMIASHFLVALSKDYQSYCNIGHVASTDHVLYLVYETLAELGDLGATGHDYASPGHYRVNLNPQFAHDWITKVNPINYRRFFQVLARYALYTTNIYNTTFCKGSPYPKDRLEKMLDKYGLLLFHTYNDNGNDAVHGHTGTNTQVTAANRLRSVFAGRNVVKLDPAPASPQAFVIDSRRDIKKAIESLQEAGQITGVSSQIPSDFRYNNGNAEISPGEVVGLALNLYNDSNVPIAGVQVLANDWDHLKGNATIGYKPCNTFADNFPLATEGAADLTGDSAATPGSCRYITRNNGFSGPDVLGPVCLVQVNEGGSSVWAVQSALMQKINLPEHNCLSGASNTRDCFVRAIKGADQATFSRIAPNKTWAQTLAPSESNSPTFNASNLIYLEISPDTPPGTTFDCRFRVRFTNCEDCWHDLGTGDKDDFLDYEYSGGAPFKIIHFQFTVID